MPVAGCLGALLVSFLRARAGVEGAGECLCQPRQQGGRSREAGCLLID